MGIWHREYGRNNASEHTLAILDDVEGGLRSLGDRRAFVRSIRVGAGMRDTHDFETEVELAPGTLLAVRYGSVDDEDWQPDSLPDGGAVAWEVVETVKEFQAFGVAALSDLLHETRTRTRKTLAKWSQEGTYVTLEDVRFVRTECWGLDDQHMTEVRLRGLDDRLQSSVDALTIDQPGDLVAELARWRSEMDVRYAAQAALARQGADGFVDRLTVNAIDMHDDVATVLQKIATGRPYGLTEALTVFMYDGHVRCHGRSEFGNFHWKPKLIPHPRALAAHRHNDWLNRTASYRTNQAPGTVE